MTEPWPDELLLERAGAIGTAVLVLLAQQERWIHRRLERIEIVSATQFTRTVAADLTVPLALADQLALLPPDRPGGPGHGATAGAATGTDPQRTVIPLGSLPKGALVDFKLIPADATRLTAVQTNVLLLSAMAPYVRSANLDPPERFLVLAQRIILAAGRADPDLTAAKGLLDRATGDRNAIDFLRKLLDQFNAKYALLIALDVVPGLPVRVTYGQRDYYRRTPSTPTEPPLEIDVPLVHASGPGPPYRLELVAPDGLEVETASLADASRQRRRIPLDTVNTKRGEGAFVQLVAPSSANRPANTALVAKFGWLTGQIHQLAAVAGLLSTLSLAFATVLCFALGTGLGGSSASALFAAPALVMSLVLGFATTRITSAPATQLRNASLWIAVIGVAATIFVTVLGGSPADLGTLKGLLIVATALSALITWAWPAAAALRARSRVNLLGDASQ